MVQLEEEEEALEQRIAKLRTAIRDMESDTESRKEVDAKTRTRLDSILKALVDAFSKLPLPSNRISISIFLCTVVQVLFEIYF